MRRTPSRLSASLFVLILPGAAAAQQTIALEDIIVSATRTPTATETLGRSYSVISGEDLEQRQTRYVADALRTLPGMTVTRTGGPGGLTNIRMRGAEPNHVLVLIDGVEVSAISEGSYDLGGLLAADIERIEVLRGPQSALWGSNATAGVISIVTKRAARDETRTGLRLETGTDGTISPHGWLRHGGTDYDVSLSAAFRRSDGFDIAPTGIDEKEGDRNLTLNGRGNWDPLPWLSLGGTIRHVDRSSETDGFDFTGGPLQGLPFDNVSRNDQRELFASAHARAESLSGRLVHDLRLAFADVTSTARTDGVPTFTTEGTRLTASYQASYAFSTGPVSHVLTGALEFEREENEASTGTQTRDLFGLVAQWQGSWEGFALTAGLRHDVNDAFADATTWSVAASYRVLPDTRLHASVGTGVTNPTFIEQFGFFAGQFVGNPALEPEESLGWDIGVEQTLLGGRLILDATYFNARLRNEIVDGFDPVANLPTSVNAPGTSPRQGVELSLTAIPLDGLSVTGAYTYTLSQDAAGLQETRRPRHQASLSAVYSFLQGRARIGAEVIYTGSQTDTDFRDFFTNGFQSDIVQLDEFVTVNLTASYRITDRAEIFGRIENLTDADRVEVFGFDGQGITGFAGIRTEF